MNDAKYAAELVRRAKVIRTANPFDFKACERKAKKKGVTSPGAYCATIDRKMNPNLAHAYSLAAYPTKDGKFEGVIRDEQTKERRFSPRFETLQEATFWVKSESHRVTNGKGTLAPMKRKGEYRANVWVPASQSNPEVSDRMHRYRARKNVRPVNPLKCWWCGKKLTKKTALVGHIDGNESNDAASNLAWTCKSCNAIEAHQHKAAGTGRRIAQNNPAKKKGKKAQQHLSGDGALNAAGWFLALNTLHGYGDGSMTHAEARKLVHETPFERRQEYNAIGTAAHIERSQARKDSMPDWAR